MRRRSRLLRGVWLIAGTLLLLSERGAAQVTFKKIVDTATAIPGGSGTFEALPANPCISGSDLAFAGTGMSGQAGVYAVMNNMLAVVADTNTPLPGGIDPFAFTAGFPNPSCSGDSVIFKGLGSGIQQGIYALISGSLEVVADTHTAIPDGTGNFVSYPGSPIFPGSPIYPGQPVISGNDAVFLGMGTGGQEGVYSRMNGMLEVIADLNTPVPGQAENFTGFPGDASISGSDVAFVGMGAGGLEGVYSLMNNMLEVVADTTTAIPGGSGLFTFAAGLPIPMASGDNVVFKGSGTGGQQGIYLLMNGSLEVIADLNTAYPSTPIFPSTPVHLFTGFPGAASISGSNVAFLGQGSGGQMGIFVRFGGALLKVIDLSDMLDGKMLSALRLGRGGLSGNQVAFGATFTDGSEGIFVATISAVRAQAPMLSWQAMLVLTAALGMVGILKLMRQRGRRVQRA